MITNPLIRQGAVLVVLLGLGCGYRYVDSRGVFGPDVSRIEIDPLQNNSSEPGFGRMLGDALVEEFARRGILTPVYGGGAAADLVLSGVVHDVEVIPAAFSSVALTIEDRLLVTLDVSVQNASTGQEVWRHTRLEVRERFQSSPDVQVYQSNKEQALRRLTSEIAGRIHDELFQKF
ncbi:MAG: hypothetical protein IH800_08510 [Myxococcales bacterium]|nr:hypothetical protein [Myxococcales bacterium]MCZ6714329.1 LPS assembly lipoprotein LptE [Deltaproteobacteria bacterium]MCZ6822360.1 LPS assembly lipoprotein LptE [Deltaproteobacteria bacterium]